MVNPFFQIGPLAVHWYSLVILVAVFVPFFLIRKKAIAQKIPVSFIDDLTLVVIPLGVFGARLYHVTTDWGYYHLHLLEIFYIWQGGLGIFGALLFGLLGLIYFCRRSNVGVFKILDLMVPYLLFGQAIGRVGNYFNQEGFGPPTNLPWGVYIDPSHRPSIYSTSTNFHPTFFYEALWDLLWFSVLFWLTRKKLPQGVITALYLIVYGVGRFGTEFLRLDTYVASGVKVGFVVSGVIVLTGLFLLFKFSKMKKPYESR